MYLLTRIITILGILALSDALLLEIAKTIVGTILGTESCPEVPEPTSTDETSCGERPTTCDAKYPYRSYDGSCNNLKHPWWGTPFTPFHRLLKNSYSDGVHKFPKTSKNKDLPNPRAMSEKLFLSKDKNDNNWTAGSMQYGQITAHDMTSVAGVGDAVCCVDGKLQDDAKTNPRCAPIEIPKSDPFYSQFHWKCMNFVRTLTTHDKKECVHVTKVAEPLTSVTGYIDVSYLYGSSKSENDKVRAFKEGLLKSDIKNGIEYLTQVSDPTKTCAVKSKKEACFLAGDPRVNQNAELTLLHNVYLLHHNYVARELYKINPHWDDEKLFQIARKIVIACHQRITYNEFLVFILGPKIIKEHKIAYPDLMDFVNDYNSTVNATPSPEYADAGFRRFHSEIQEVLNAYNEGRSVNNSVNMSDWMRRPSVIQKGDNYAGMCRGLTTQPQSAVDRYYPSAVLTQMFKEGVGDNNKLGTETPGIDLKAFDIWRGRDHGLGTYEQAVEKCCLGKLETWKDAENFFEKEDIERLKKFYPSTKDIELVVGASLEKQLPDALSGAVTACIIADQLFRTRVGDRFFFQNKGVFTKGQLKEILHTNFGDLICLAKGIKKMQPKAMQLISPENELAPCSSRKKFDFSQWKESK